MPSRWPRYVAVYAAVAATFATGVAAWDLLAGTGGPAFDAEHLATNEHGALWKVIIARDSNGRGVAWQDVKMSFAYETVTDGDGIAQAQEVFFVAAADGRPVQVLTVTIDDRLVWSGAFQATEPEPSLLPDAMPPPPGVGARPFLWPLA